jgi:RimJ/RimL family protein N-acetyltransferase
MPDKPLLHGERLTLRPLVESDARNIFQSLSEQETMRLTGTFETFTFEQVEVYCARVAAAENRADYIITLSNSNTFIGEAVINDINWHNRSAHYRIAVSQNYVDQGYGSEATRLMMAYAFNTLGLHRIELEVYNFNPRARRVYEKIGFVAEGELRDVLYMDGEFHNATFMSLLEHEFTTTP